MKELVLDIVGSYVNRITMIEELVARDQYATATVDASLAELFNERTRLETSLRELLARNCSLRRKDFNLLMERIFVASEGEKGELEKERKVVIEELKGYLDEQKQLVTCLKQQLFTYKEGDEDALETTIAEIKASQRKGQEVFTLLRGFQLRLKTFQRKQEEVNQELQRLVARDVSLKLEDLRLIKAAQAGQRRKIERYLRRQEVARLLTHFKEQRQER